MGLLGLLVAALLLGSEAPPAPPAAPPLAGFSYSPELSEWMDRNPQADLAFLLSSTNPDLVRLPVYWDVTQPSPHNLDFSSIDGLLAVVAWHNSVSTRQTRVILTIGARNFLYPELHTPAWIGPRQQPQLGAALEGAAYHEYFDATLLRYRNNPLLYAWQVENEPFDNVDNESTGYDEITTEQLNWEVAEVHRLDGHHRAVTTTFDAWNVIVDWMQLYATPVLWALHGYPSGHPGPALDAADALGLDLYVDGTWTPFRFSTVALRTSWKAEAIKFWADKAKAQGKSVWLTEMQAEPWAVSPGSFSPDDLLASAATYRREPLQVVLLWGAETWLADPAWMSAAAGAISILRSP
jgi:hypothetical protein